MNKCSVPPFKIEPNDCVGDSIGKHNYNALILDTGFCNLSSLISIDNKLQKVVEGLSFLMQFYDLTAKQLVTDDFTNKIYFASTTVNLLSSFWGNYEFSISLPINALTLTTNDLSILCPVLSATTPQKLNTITNDILKPLCTSELNLNYFASQYPDNTIVNVSCLLYNLLPAIGNPDPLVKVSYVPSTTGINAPINTFSYNNRLIYATYTRDTVYVTTGMILRFVSLDKKWNYIGYIHDNNSSTAKPNKNIQAIVQSVSAVSAPEKNQDSIYLQNCQPIKEKTWYSCDRYAYANGLCTGTSSTLGTVKLTFRTPNNQTTVFTHTAQGYNPTTNTGGLDVYMEFNGSVVNAYEKYPNSKVLVNSWEFPYKNQSGINFKFTKGDDNLPFSVCASEKIF